MKILDNVKDGFTEDGVIMPFSTAKGLTVQVPSEIESYFKHVTGREDDEKSDIRTISVLQHDRVITYVFIELEDVSALTKRELFLSLAKAFTACKKQGLKNISLRLDNVFTETVDADLLVQLLEAAFLADYEFKKYKSNATESRIESVNLVFDRADLEGLIEEAEALAAGTMVARDLVNEPSMYMTPEQLAKDALSLGEQYQLEVEILDEKQIERFHMNAFLAVARGSINKPRLIVMRYRGNTASEENICLVGKGITFDSGGYSLKPTASLPTMHADMAGAAAVIGAMETIARLKLKKNVIAVIPACENRISEDAYLPGHVLTSMSGKTIEVISTDAEGRLVLADAITYALREEGADAIIDIATLTGGARHALGDKTAAYLTNDETLSDLAKEASSISSEKAWQLPLDQELKPAIKSIVADVKNSALGANVGGSTILGALFLEAFVENKPWLHLDIASVAWSSTGLPYSPKGATGFGVNLLYQMIKHAN